MMSDPVGDFLAREQNELAGLDDDSSSNSVAGILSQNGISQNELPWENGMSLDYGGDLAALNADEPTPNSQRNQPKIEQEKIRKLREDQEERLAKKDEDEEKKKEEWRNLAKKELEDWYKSRKDQLESAKKANRLAEMELLNERKSSESGAQWENVTKLCEFNPKNVKNVKDVSKMR